MPKYPYRILSVYGSKVDEPTLLGGLRALTTGETSGHITTDEYFTDPELYDKYIKDTDIPCRIFKDKETGETVYRVHLSYGPARSNALHLGSVLDKDEYVNSLNAHYLTRSPEMSLIDQKKLNLRSPLDFVGITQHQILLSTQSIIKTTPKNATAVQKFQKNIQDALAVFTDPNNKQNKDKTLAIYQEAFKQEFEKLRLEIAPDSTADQFANDFHEFGSIGIEPTETRKLTLITAAQQEAGMQGSRIDLRLAKIREIHDVMKHEDYNFILNNCAHKAAAVERAGVSESNDHRIKNTFNHTAGYNELKQFGPLSLEGAAGAVMFIDPALGRHLETPVNVLRNSDRLVKNLKVRLQHEGLKPRHRSDIHPNPLHHNRKSHLNEQEALTEKRKRPEDGHKDNGPGRKYRM